MYETYKITEDGFRNTLLQILILCWIAFAVFKYPVNPFFFVVSICFAIVLLFASCNKMQLELTDSELLLKEKALFSEGKINRRVLLNEIKISTVEEEEQAPLILKVVSLWLYHTTFSRRPHYIIRLILKNKSSISFFLNCNKSELVKMSGKINSALVK